MRKKIIIHVGTPKTGTSVVQRFLAENEDFLRDHGITYPIMYPEEGRWFVNGHGFLVPSDRRRLLDTIASAPTARVLFSEEMIFFTGSFSAILDGLEKHELKVILYLRNAPDYLASLWGELNKYENRFFPEGLHEFLQSDRYLLQLNRFAEFAQAHPEFEYVVYPYERSMLRNGDSVHDFLSVLGIESTGIGEMAEENVSRPRRFSDIMQDIYSRGVMQRCTLDVEAVAKAIDRLADQISSGDPRKIVETIDDETIRSVADRHRPILDELVDRYGDGRRVPPYPDCLGVKREPHLALGSKDRMAIAVWTWALSTFNSDEEVASANKRRSPRDPPGAILKTPAPAGSPPPAVRA